MYQRCVFTTRCQRNLASSLNLPHPYRFTQVSEYIRAGRNATTEQIKKSAREHFVAHALLGNIDVAKEDNFVVDEENKAYLIDAGANFMFRSLGQLRKEPPNIVTELETLRDKSCNDLGPEWFGNVTDEEIRQQLEAILTKQEELYAAVWTLSQHMQLSDHLRDKFLQCFSDRLDMLVTRYIRQPQRFAQIGQACPRGRDISRYSDLHTSRW